MTALDDLCATPFHEADDAARARILSRLADTELSVALVAEAAQDAAELRVFDLPDLGPVAIACDGEERLADFFGAPVAFAAMPGRVLAGMLAGAGTGLLVNPGYPSQMLIEGAALAWLRTALSAAPEADEAALTLKAPEAGVAVALGAPLSQRLSDLRGRAGGAFLAARTDGGHVLTILGAPEDDQPALAKALAETLAFLPPQPGGVDVAFARAAAPPEGALVFDLTPLAPPPPAPKGPPRLR